MSRSLSDLEAKLILHLEWEKQPVVTIEDTMAILGCSYDHARQLLHRLAHRRWLSPKVYCLYGQLALLDERPEKHWLGPMFSFALEIA